MHPFSSQRPPLWKGGCRDTFCLGPPRRSPPFVYPSEVGFRARGGSVPLLSLVEGLSMFARELEGEPLYVHIFTDDPDLAAIARAFRHLFPSIDFGFHESKQGGSAVVQDLMSMARAPCLIRGGSNLAQMAQLIGQHRAVVYPRWKERKGYGPEMMRLSHSAK